MKSWAVIALIAGACSPNDHPVVAQEPLRLTYASPATIGLHGGTTVTVAYSGTIPEHAVVRVTGNPQVTIDPVADTFQFVSAQHAAGPATIEIDDANDDLLASDSTLLTYVPLPVHLTAVGSGPTNLAEPLHPELVTPCARFSSVVVQNTGETEMNMLTATSTAPEFSAVPDDTCLPLTPNGQCTVKFCFSSTAPGAWTGAVTLHTGGDDFIEPMSATVAPLTPDVSFARLGNTDGFWNDTAGATATGTGIVGWGSAELFVVDTMGDVVGESVTAMVNGFLANSIRGVRGGPPLTGFFVLIGDDSGGSWSTILHFDDAGTRDAAFGQLDLPFGAGGYYWGLERAESGRLLAIAGDPIAVVALANGAVDTSYGTSGVTTVPTGAFAGRSAIDSQGRLYLGLGSSAVRLTASGAIDSSFTFTSVVAAVAVDSSDRPYVASGTTVQRLTDTGAPQLTIDTGALVSDVAVDGSGRIYATVNGVVQRYDATGTLDRDLGWDTSRATRCVFGQHCWIVGVDSVDAGDGVTFNQPYVLQLAD